jgi:glucose/arabinose dehydrogenase
LILGSVQKKTGTRVSGVVLAASAALMLSGCDDGGGDPNAQIGAHPRLPDLTQYLLPPMHIARVVGWKQQEKPAVAQGLQVQAFADGFQHPRMPYVLPNGDVLVVESKSPNIQPTHRPKDLVMGWLEHLSTSGSDPGSSNRITLLRDTNGDGVPELRSIFLDHLNSPFGVILLGNDLYVAETDKISKFPYREGDTKITAPGTTLTTLPGGPIDHHWTKSLTASPDGSLLYVGVGSNSNITENGIGAERDRAAILEVERATGRSRIFASGLRNPTGVAFEPQSRVLWAIVNERDEVGPDLVPDYLTSVVDGGFYGWPYSYFGQNIDPRVQPRRPDLVAKAIVPDYALSSHVAPLGLVFYEANSLPEKYRGGAFIAEHGSWNRDRLNGYKVVFVPFKDGGPDGMAQDVVTGFLDADNHARGRPVGLAIDKTGALLIADDTGNTVWRVSSAAASPATSAAK